MPPLAYCDNNFVITAHDAHEEYKIHLRELASGGKVKFVLSPWHWREMARDADHARGTSVADFCDSLDPVWLYDRRTIQKKEVSSAFFKFANLPTAQPAMLDPQRTCLLPAPTRSSPATRFPKIACRG
jgi:hypothetical protein